MGVLGKHQPRRFKIPPVLDTSSLLFVRYPIFAFCMALQSATYSSYNHINFKACHFELVPIALSSAASAQIVVVGMNSRTTPGGDGGKVQ